MQIHDAHDVHGVDVRIRLLRVVDGVVIGGRRQRHGRRQRQQAPPAEQVRARQRHRLPEDTETDRAGVLLTLLVDDGPRRDARERQLRLEHVQPRLDGSERERFEEICMLPVERAKRVRESEGGGVWGEQRRGRCLQYLHEVDRRQARVARFGRSEPPVVLLDSLDDRQIVQYLEFLELGGVDLDIVKSDNVNGHAPRLRLEHFVHRVLQEVLLRVKEPRRPRDLGDEGGREVVRVSPLDDPLERVVADVVLAPRSIALSSQALGELHDDDEGEWWLQGWPIRLEGTASEEAACVARSFAILTRDPCLWFSMLYI